MIFYSIECINIKVDWKRDNRDDRNDRDEMKRREGEFI
jgi:hypothetical protein